VLRAREPPQQLTARCGRCYHWTERYPAIAGTAVKLRAGSFNRIFLQGWSNGGSTTLNVMIRQGARAGGFRAALAFYPGCGRDALLAPKVATSAPITMFLGSDDEEVSPVICQQVAQRSTEAGAPISVAFYPSATHDFDDPGKKRQSVPGNGAAKADAMARAAAIIEKTKEKGR